MQSQKDKIQLEPIGLVRTVFDHKFGTPRQGALAPSSRAEFHLNPEWRGKGLFSGLEGFSHVWLVSFFHQNKNTRRAGKVHPPRLLGEAIGVLASRSPHRPNAVGLTLARLERVDGDKIYLSGIDLVDRTPILDIKPYLPDADRPAEFKSGWAGRLAETQVESVFEDEALQQIQDLVRAGKIEEREQFLKLVREVLALDPRPLAYRERVNERFAIVLGGMDVHARYHEGRFTVIAVSPLAAGESANRSSKASDKSAPRKENSRPREHR